VLDEEPVVPRVLHLLGEDLCLDAAFAALAGQMLSDLAFDSPRAAEAIAAWRRASERS
jgi:hypothetical protein